MKIKLNSVFDLPATWIRLSISIAHAINYPTSNDKILVEQVLMHISTILRLPAMYGAGDRQHRFLPYLQQMLDQ